MRMFDTLLHLDDESVVKIPASVVDFPSFRRWTLSDTFPTRGRIDCVNGLIEVDMSPSNIQRHSVPKARIGSFIDTFVNDLKMGQVYIDQTRVIAPNTDLSCEPDVVFISWKRLASREVVLRPSKKIPRDGLDQMEVDGGPDLVVEVLSPSSIKKDTQRLLLAYFRAGVLEYWIVDALGKTPRLIVYKRGKKGFKAVMVDRQGFQKSAVLGVAVKLVSDMGPVPNTLVYNVLTK